MCAGSPTAGSSSSCLSRPDNEFETYSDNHTSCAVGKRAAEGVAHCDVGDDPSAAMKVDESRQRPGAAANWPVDPYRQIGGGSRNETLVNAGNVFGHPSEILERQHRDASLGGTHRFERSGTRILHLLKKGLRLWVEWHLLSFVPLPRTCAVHWLTSCSKQPNVMPLSRERRSPVLQIIAGLPAARRLQRPLDGSRPRCCEAVLALENIERSESLKS
jgi:hypothetical protein